MGPVRLPRDVSRTRSSPSAASNPDSTALRAVVSRVLENPIDAVLARSLFATDDAGQIAEFVEAYADSYLGSTIAGCRFFAQSAGAVFGLTLSSSATVVVKVHGPGTQGDTLNAAYRVQQLLSSKAFPCPEVLLPAVHFRGAWVGAQRYLDDGDLRDAHDPAVRRAMAEAFAGLIARAQLLKYATRLPPHLPSDQLWPEPHNVLFNFKSTRAGAGWIDEIAARARGVLTRGEKRNVLGHADWSTKNMRFSAGEITAVYDWDSACVGDEMSLLASAATHFTVGGAGRGDPRPTRDESLAFVDEYVRARGRPLTGEQRQRLSAGAAYAIAYTARCEHARDPEGHDIDGSFRELLQRAKGLDYLAQ